MFIAFSMPPNCPNINHLDYVDDIFIFSSGNIPSIRLIMNCINAYELSSGKLVNRDKSLFLPVSKTSAQRINRWKRCTNFREKTFLLLILVAHCMLVRNMLECFDYIVSKVVKRLNGWHGKLLCYGEEVGRGPVVSIKSVLQ